MPPFEKKTLLVANPAAQNGNGAQAAAHAAALLREVVGEDRLDVVLTEGPGHAEQVSAQAQGYGTVVALGGDGIIHETANGLLRLPECARPTLGVVPVGSGNDYARTLGISARSVDEAVRQLAGAHPRPFDVGRCNGRHFVETLSFGLDAAIALDTVERRRVTGKTGTALYLESGLDQLLHHRDAHRFTATLDAAQVGAAVPPADAGQVGDATPPVDAGQVGEGPGFERTPEGAAAAQGAACAKAGTRTVDGPSYLFAVQIGPTYGGGFRICPQARTDDGLLDLCVARPPLSALRAVFLFLLAKNAWHTRFKQLEFYQTRSLRLSFDGPLPVQMDGEPFQAPEYDIACVPHALNVLVP